MCSVDHAYPESLCRCLSFFVPIPISLWAVSPACRPQTVPVCMSVFSPSFSSTVTPGKLASSKVAVKSSAQDGGSVKSSMDLLFDEISKISEN